MDIGFYIADLLSEQDEISVPGLGTFTKIRVPASYDKTINSFRPPSYRLSFQETVSGFHPLREYISSQKNLSISSAEYFIKKFSAGILELLNTSDSAEIKPLGVFYKKNDSLKFEASGSFELAGNFYGLKPIAELKNKSGSTAETIKRELEEEHAEIEEPEETSTHRSRPILIISILVFIIAGAISLYFLNTEFNSYVQNLREKIFPVKEQSAPVYVPLIDSTQTQSDSIEKSADTLLRSKDSLALNTSTPVPDTGTLPPKAEISAEEGISFEIIGAAFARKSEAEEYIRQLAAKGIQAKIAENMPGKMLKISLGSYKDEETANTELARIQKDINKAAWIARVKPKKNPK